MNRLIALGLGCLLLAGNAGATEFPEDFRGKVKAADADVVQRWYDQGQEFVVLDVRTPKEFRKDGRVPGSVNHSYTLRDREREKNRAMLDTVADTISPDTTVLVMCSHGMRATQAAWELQEEKGFSAVYVFPGGFEGHHMGGYPGGDGWKAAGLPLQD